jgi:biotin synthase
MTDGNKQVVTALMGGDATPATLKAALQLRGGDQESLFAAARERRDAAFPARQVEMRSVIEISNICFQRCKYCAIGGKERNRAYTIGIDEFVERAQVVYDRGRRVLLVQSGENDAQTFVDHVTSAVGELRQRLPEMVVVLCLGNMSRDQYRQLHDAGARRYILKFETSNERLYASLKPRDTLARRGRRWTTWSRTSS